MNTIFVVEYCGEERCDKTTLLDIGFSVFTKGQAYVGFSRVKTLDEVHLISLDPSQIKAQESSIVKYKRLRTLYRGLGQIKYKQKTRKKKSGY
jgi:ATP-dependent exoDNAse (exonuclease V) alpha subunit